MITDSGKEIISKYMLGQAPAYATHISIGCGATPLDQDDNEQTDVATKDRMNFEMTRIPISSRGFVEDNGVTKLSLIAQLPTENRYEITEVGLWSDANNILAKGFDSRIIFDFDSDEQWQAHDTTTATIPSIDNLGTNGVIDDKGQSIFRVDSGNSLLEEASRKSRKEGPRFLNTSIFVKGNTSNIQSTDFSITSASVNPQGTQITYIGSNTLIVGDKVTVTASSNKLFDVLNASVVSASANSFKINKIISSSATSTGGVAWKSGSWTPEENPSGFTSRHVHFSGINFNIGNNSPSDILTLCFSLVDKTSAGDGTPQFVKILMEFLKNESTKTSGYARAELYIPGSQFVDRYKAISFPISNLITSSDFIPAEVRLAKIYCYVGVQSGSATIGSVNHYVALDGFRLDNISTINPLYKMVGYSSTRTDDGSPIIKYRNTNNYVEFRFGVGVT